MVTTKHKETKESHHHEASFLEDSDDSGDIDAPTHKRPRINSHHNTAQSSTAPTHRDDDKVSIPDEEKMNRNLKAI